MRPFVPAQQYHHRPDLHQRVAEYLFTHGPATAGRIAHDCLLPTNAASIVIAEMRKAGTINRLSLSSAQYDLLTEARAA